MREIKFRGKCKWENHPRYGEWIIAPDQIDISEFWKMVEQQDGIDPSTVGQFTGLKDSEGVDIYEGDIVYLAGYGNYEVEFPFGQLYDSGAENDIGQIIGNVYDKENHNDQS